MNTKKIDILNIFLIIISLIIAIRIPFELFLFSYAILGPLHYLTEINWLREKNYFISANKNWSLIFVILTILVSMYPIIKFSGLEMNKSLEYGINLINEQTNVFLLIAFLFAVSLLFFKKIKDLTLALIFIILISFISITFLPSLFFFIGVFLPTLIHVYIFTLFFILYGALKAKSSYGFYLGIILLTVPFVISYIPIDYINYMPSLDTGENFDFSNMAEVSYYIAEILNELDDGNFSFLSGVGLRIQIFISFAYT